MKKAILVCTAAILALACATKPEGDAQNAAPAELIAAGVTSASFDPTGSMFVYTRGMTLVVQRPGDERVYHLTTSPPAEAPATEAGEQASLTEEAPSSSTECVPAEPFAPVAGPQGGWHGHAAWSPDGRFIAFVAPWKDGNCNDADDADWDVWIVRVDGLDLDGWVKEVVADEDDPESKSHYIVGPDGAGLEFYQVTNAPAREQKPTWASCSALAFTDEEGLRLVDLSGYPGICERTAAEEAAEREARIEKLQARVTELGDKITGLEAKVAALQTPAEDDASKAPAPKPPTD
jgi:hypothetical protein